MATTTKTEDTCSHCGQATYRVVDHSGDGKVFVEPRERLAVMDNLRMRAVWLKDRFDMSEDAFGALCALLFIDWDKTLNPTQEDKERVYKIISEHPEWGIRRET